VSNDDQPPHSSSSSSLMTKTVSSHEGQQNLVVTAGALLGTPTESISINLHHSLALLILSLLFELHIPAPLTNSAHDIFFLLLALRLAELGNKLLTSCNVLFKLELLLKHLLSRIQGHCGFERRRFDAFYRLGNERDRKFFQAPSRKSVSIKF